ncbi:hypothetical protein VTN96DRAFT_7339 [Rasamsonia emersonii]
MKRSSLETRPELQYCKKSISRVPADIVDHVPEELLITPDTLLLLLYESMKTGQPVRYSNVGVDLAPGIGTNPSSRTNRDCQVL